MSRSKKSVPLERYTEMSQEEVGKVLGISAMRVNQIERAAFAKIRAELARRGLMIDALIATERKGELRC